MVKKRENKKVSENNRKGNKSGKKVINPIIRSRGGPKEIPIDYEKIKLFAKSGFSDAKMISGLGINRNTFRKWKDDPRVKEIISEERSKLKDNKIVPGRPPVYEVRYCKMMYDYFNSIKPYKNEKIVTVTKDGTKSEEFKKTANDPPMFSEFAKKIGVHKDTLKNWAEEYPEFGYTFKMCEDMQEIVIVKNGLGGLYQPTYAGLISKNWLNMKDKQDVTTNNKSLKPITYVIPAFKESINEPDPDDDGAAYMEHSSGDLSDTDNKNNDG